LGVAVVFFDFGEAVLDVIFFDVGEGFLDATFFDAVAFFSGTRAPLPPTAFVVDERLFVTVRSVGFDDGAEVPPSSFCSFRGSFAFTSS
jgi:hypothetical protein